MAAGVQSPTHCPEVTRQQISDALASDADTRFTQWYYWSTLPGDDKLLPPVYETKEEEQLRSASPPPVTETMAHWKWLMSRGKQYDPRGWCIDRDRLILLTRTTYHCSTAAEQQRLSSMVQEASTEDLLTARARNRFHHRLLVAYYVRCYSPAFWSQWSTIPWTPTRTSLADVVTGCLLKNGGYLLRKLLRRVLVVAKKAEQTNRRINWWTKLRRMRRRLMDEQARQREHSVAIVNE